MGRFEVFGDTHRDGDSMLMIRNGKTIRAIYKTPDHVYADKLRTKVWDEVEASKNPFDVYMKYYRLAYKRDIYVSKVAWSY